MESETTRNHDALRRRAEKVLSRLEPTGQLQTNELQDVAEIIHELSVHEVELGLQGEELQKTLASLLETQHQLQQVYDLAPLPVFCLSLEGTIRSCNLKGHEWLRIPRNFSSSLTHTHFIPRLVVSEDRPRMLRALRECVETGKGNASADVMLDGENRRVQFTLYRPARESGGEEILVYAMDIQETADLTEKLDKKIKQLEEALQHIQTLRGILPICSYCKKIRDDQGYWEQVEVYVSKYSEADFSHGICPDCMSKHYPEVQM